MNEKLIKENIIWVILLLAVVIGGGYFTYDKGMNVLANMEDIKTKKQEFEKKDQTLQGLLKAQEAKKMGKKKQSESGKIIYKVMGAQFTSEASFGIMFENILSNIAASGIRIRSIDYNYAPQDDKILLTNIEGYNACELSFTAVGKYAQLQNFFKNIAKEKYLSSIQEIYLEPYDNDKSILIAKFKIRIYTQTI